MWKEELELVHGKRKQSHTNSIVYKDFNFNF